MSDLPLGRITQIIGPVIDAEFPPEAEQLARDLLKQGTDANAKVRYGQTALMLAAHAGYVEAARELIAHGADLNVTAKYGLSALMLAIVAGHAEVARMLAEAGADLTLRGSGAPGFAGKTAHDLALARGWNEMAVILKPIS